MTPYIILAVIGLYFSALIVISYFTSKNANNESYFVGNRQSIWFLVAFGMISDSLSGVTFISVPGAVGKSQFGYIQIILGYILGYVAIAEVLLPLYYRLKLTSIYTFLGDAQYFGRFTQKTASFFFIVSRLLGAGARLFLTASVIQLFVFDALGVPFALSVCIIIGLILFYTYKGGIKTLVWTDAFQSTFLLGAVVVSIFVICNGLDKNIFTLLGEVKDSPYSQIFFWDWKAKSYFWKQFIGGAFICLTMTGLDQSMMQKNLSCKSLGEAKKNIYLTTLMITFVNVFFVTLGALLYLYATQKGIAIPEKTDRLFPMLALEHLGIFAGLVFIVGLTAATFSSADSVLTTLTTSFYIDFLQADQLSSEAAKSRLRHGIHIGFAVLLLGIILVFRATNQAAVIDTVLRLANYTYGPILGLFIFGIFVKRKTTDALVPFVCVAAPLLCFLLDSKAKTWFGGYAFGLELLLVNGFFTVVGLFVISKKV